MSHKKAGKPSIITKFLDHMGIKNIADGQFLEKIERIMDEDPEIVQTLKDKQPKNKIN